MASEESNEKDEIQVLTTPSITYTPEKPYIGDRIIFHFPQNNESGKRIDTYSIQWGDGTSSVSAIWQSWHIYNKAGTYQVSVSGFDQKNILIYQGSIEIRIRDKKYVNGSAWELLTPNPIIGKYLTFELKKQFMTNMEIMQ
ncbi:hypothetical protein [Methanospirillum hungatei]|uniref:hypothetical protein n=1 Tax=Methanospirillum hungatei TaxID=2203 RepID=UPI0026EA59ED|nr:hypothetical protein [Methanospirillum hungatei]MCA1917533.1 hypothetical protein [Methanospirillum hungatei]